MPRRPFLLLDKAQNFHLFCLKAAGFGVPFRALAIRLLTDQLLKQALVAHYRRPLDIACQSKEPGCFRLYLDDIGERRERACARASAGRSLARLIKRGLLESCSHGR
jgi:hypothetical protein